MLCPGCKVSISHSAFAHAVIGDQQSEIGHEVAYGNCPECRQFIIAHRTGRYRWREEGGELLPDEKHEILFPRITNVLIHQAIPDEFKTVFNEAFSVLSISPKASAALSRRLLQTIIREAFGIKKKDLREEIKELIKDTSIPEELRNEVDAVRNVGNFAAHPIKFQNTGEIVEVEPHEATWLLEVLEAILDYKFVQPAEKGERKKKLNSKLDQMGKSPILES